MPTVNLEQPPTFQPSGDKSSWYQRTQEIVELGYPAVAPVLPDILVWLQDLNWPGATTIANFLLSIGQPLVPHIKPILLGTDELWQYWVLRKLVQFWTRDIVVQIEPELLSLIKQENADKDVFIEVVHLLRKVDLGDTQTMLRGVEIQKRKFEEILARELSKINVSGTDAELEPYRFLENRGLGDAATLYRQSKLNWIKHLQSNLRELDEVEQFVLTSGSET